MRAPTVADESLSLAELAPNLQRNRVPADRMWRNVLLQIPTVFGRLVFLASLRDEASGRYRDEKLDSLLGPEDTDRSIRHSHYQVFSEWLGFSLAEQKDDISEYLRGASGQRSRLQSMMPYRQLIPASAREVERQLYLTDLETLLELLRAEHSGASSVPEA